MAKGAKQRRKTWDKGNAKRKTSYSKVHIAKQVSLYFVKENSLRLLWHEKENVYRKEKFSGYNKPKRTPGKKFVAKGRKDYSLWRPNLCPLRKTNLHARRATVQGQVVLKVRQIN